jgi:hypothetical protein
MRLTDIIRFLLGQIRCLLVASSNLLKLLRTFVSHVSIDILFLFWDIKIGGIYLPALKRRIAGKFELLVAHAFILAKKSPVGLF